MKRVVRESASNADSASARSWNLPSRSVNVVNIMNESQSSIGSLNAWRMRGRSSLPERRWSSASASSRPSRPKYVCSRYTIAQRCRPSSTFTWKRFRRS
jgi:hypothetical protein